MDKHLIVMNYINAGCPIINTLPLPISNVFASNGVIECTDCDHYDNGKCPAFIKLKAMKPKSANNVVFSNTVASEAERLGISKSEVRRRRTLR